MMVLVYRAACGDGTSHVFLLFYNYIMFIYTFVFRESRSRLVAVSSDTHVVVIYWWATL